MSTTDDITPFQPTLPAEINFTQAELVFMDESPAGLFPENQDSNFGYIIRKIFSDLAQDVSDWQNTLYNERFVETAIQFLDQWEVDVGLPANPTGISIAQQRVAVLSRLRRGPFTRTRRNSVIEDYIATTFGNPIQLVPEGVEITAAGIPIYGESANPATLYRVYENQPIFSYEVWIANTTTPDVNSLTRELKRITPAGIAFNIDNAQANILDYFRTVRGMAPIGYWRLGNLLDSSGRGNNGVIVGTVTAGGVAAPGLLNAAISGADGATDFPGGTNNYIQVPPHTAYATTREVSMTAWIQPDTLPAAGNNYAAFLASAAESSYLTLYSGSYLGFSAWINGAQKGLYSSAGAIQAGVKYFVAATYDGNTMRLYKNGALIASQDYPQGSMLLASGYFLIGLAGFGAFDGKIDEVAVFNRALSQAEITLLYNTGINVR